MSAVLPAQYVVHRAFQNFDHMCESIRQWDLDVQQLDGGLFSGGVFQFGSGNVHISEARFGRSLLQQGTPPQGLRTIAVPADVDVRFQWRGKSVCGNDLLIFPQGAELEAVSDENFHVYTCSFTEEILASVCEQNGLLDLDDLCAGKEVVRCSDEAMSGVRQLLGELSRTLKADNEAIRHPEADRRLTTDLPHQLLWTIANANQLSLPTAASKREQALNLALRFIERFAHEAISIRDVCQFADVSQRTLEYAFKERFSVSPKSFLSAYRLCQVRRVLQASHPPTGRIVDAANLWGFWHMGQFAADYRKLFGELPSQTKRKKLHTRARMFS